MPAENLDVSYAHTEVIGHEGTNRVVRSSVDWRGGHAHHQPALALTADLVPAGARNDPNLDRARPTVIRW
jgi:hypothetical protein